jgi:hypothetical protein
MKTRLSCFPFFEDIGVDFCSRQKWGMRATEATPTRIFPQPRHMLPLYHDGFVQKVQVIDAYIWITF